MDNLMILFDNISASDLIKIILAAAAIIGAFNVAIFKILHWLEKWRLMKNKQEKNEELLNDIKEIEEGISLICEGLKMVLADGLNEKCKRYWHLNYIPEDEFDEFIKQHSAYKALHGNSTIDEKYEKVVHGLKVLEDEDAIKDLKEESE